MKMNRFLRGVGLLAAAGAGVVYLAVAPGAAAASANSYCADDVTSGAQHCFTTFAASVSYATGGRVHLHNAATARHVSAGEMAGAATSVSPNDVTPDTNYVLSVLYQDKGYGGSTLTAYGSSPCGDFTYSSMPSGWNDKVSSLINYSGCGATLYWDTGFGPPTYPTGVDASVSSFSNFDNKTSSIKWCPHSNCT